MGDKGTKLAQHARWATYKLVLWFVLTKWKEVVPEFWRLTLSGFWDSFTDLSAIAFYLAILHWSRPPIEVQIVGRGFLVVIAAYLLFKNIRGLLHFLAVPCHPADSAPEIEKWQKLADDCAKGFLTEANKSKKLSQPENKKFLVVLTSILLSGGRIMSREMLPRIDLVLLSLRILATFGILVVTYALFYHYLYLIDARHFRMSDAPSFPAFLVYSFSIFSTVDLGGVAPGTLFVRVVSASELVFQLTLIAIIIPLIFIFYERNGRFMRSAFDEFKKDCSSQVKGLIPAAFPAPKLKEMKDCPEDAPSQTKGKDAV